VDLQRQFPRAIHQAVVDLQRQAGPALSEALSDLQAHTDTATLRTDSSVDDPPPLTYEQAREALALMLALIPAMLKDFGLSGTEAAGLAVALYLMLRRFLIRP
jgi:hypothetical protein